MIRQGLYNGQRVYVNTSIPQTREQYAIVYQDGTQATAPVNEVTFDSAPALSHTEDVEAENARLRAEVERLKARQFTPDMLAVWEEYLTMKETQSYRYVINNQAYLRSNLWHTFIAAMTEGEGK